jgi:fatty acid desaturase
MVEQGEGGEIAMKIKKTPPRDLALLAIAVALMLGGAVTLVWGWLAAGIAIPLIAIGIALVVIAQRDVQHRHAGHIRCSE